MSHPHGPALPIHHYPELGGIDPTLAVDAEISNANQPMTPEARRADLVDMTHDVEALKRAHVQSNRIAYASGPHGNARLLVANEQGWARGGRRAGRDAYRRNLELARTADQQEAQQDAAEDVAAIADRMRNRLQNGNLTDFVGRDADTILAAENNDWADWQRTNELEHAALIAQDVADRRFDRWETRRRHNAAHPTTDPELAEIRRLRTGIVGHHAIRASVAADRARQAHAAQQGASEESAGLGTLYEAITHDIFDEHAERLRRADDLDDHVSVRLGMWRVGEEPSYPGQDSEVTNMQLLRYRNIDDMPIRDTGRAEKNTSAGIDTYRIEERHILRPNTAANSYYSEYLEDGGIRTNITNPYDPYDGRVVYQDGSRADWNGHEWVRINSNGTRWTAPHRAERLPNSAAHQNREHATDATLEHNAVINRTAWEEVRSTRAEAHALEADIDLTERYGVRIGENIAAITQIDGTTREHHDSIRTQQAIIAGIHTSASARGIGAEDLAAIDAANNAITDLHTAIARLTITRRIHVRNVEHFRTNTNRTEYWVARHLVNREPTVPGHDREALMHTDGTVERQDATINGFRGRWQIRIDGMTTLLNPNGTVHSRYRPNGERI